MALQAHQARRANDWREEGHRWIAGCPVSKRIAVQACLPRPLGHTARDVNAAGAEKKTSKVERPTPNVEGRTIMRDVSTSLDMTITNDRREEGHRWIAGCAVSKGIAVQTGVS